MERGLALLHSAFKNDVATVCMRMFDRQTIAGGKIGNGLQICRAGGEAFAERRARQCNR